MAVQPETSRSSPARPAGSARPPPAGWPPRASTWSPPPGAPTGSTRWSPRSGRRTATAVTCDVTSDDVGGRAGRGGRRAGRRRSRCWSTTPAAPAALDPVEPAPVDDWQWMYDVNVLGTLRVTKALLPALEASGAGHDRDDQLDRRPDRLRGRRRLRRGQARADRAGRDAAAGAVRPAGPGRSRSTRAWCAPTSSR